MPACSIREGRETSLMKRDYLRILKPQVREYIPRWLHEGGLHKVYFDLCLPGENSRHKLCKNRLHAGAEKCP